MKKIISIYLLVVIASISFAQKDQKDYSKALEKNSFEDYIKFIQKHKSSPLVKDAMDKASLIKYLEATQMGDIESMEKFVRSYSKSSKYQEAKEKLDNLKESTLIIHSYEYHSEFGPSKEDKIVLSSPSKSTTDKKIELIIPLGAKRLPSESLLDVWSNDIKKALDENFKNLTIKNIEINFFKEIVYPSRLLSGLAMMNDLHLLSRLMSPDKESLERVIFKPLVKHNNSYKKSYLLTYFNNLSIKFEFLLNSFKSTSDYTYIEPVI